MRRFLALLLPLALAACAPSADADADLGPEVSYSHIEPEYLTPYGPPQNPFSPAVRAGGLLYLSGRLGTDSTGRLASGGIEAETRQTLENIRDVLARTGSSMDRVVKCTVMMADMAEWPAMNRIYATYFPTNRPARSAFGVAALALDARVEIECVAAE